MASCTDCSGIRTDPNKFPFLQSICPSCFERYLKTFTPEKSPEPETRSL